MKYRTMKLPGGYRLHKCRVEDRSWRFSCSFGFERWGPSVPVSVWAVFWLGTWRFWLERPIHQSSRDTEAQP